MAIDPDVQVLIDALKARIVALESRLAARQPVEYVISYDDLSVDVFELKSGV